MFARNLLLVKLDTNVFFFFQVDDQMKLLQHSWSDLLILDHLHQRIHNRLQVSVCYMIFESENGNICIIMKNNRLYYIDVGIDVYS